VVRATATLIPVLLAAVWLVRLASHLWRARIVERAGDEIARVASALGGQVRPRFAGFAVVAPDVSVVWRGGLGGLVTRVRVGKHKRRELGLLGAEAVRGIVDNLRS